MSTDRFHKAAKDGLLDVLKEATRKEANGRDEAGMTPTLWAAFEGRLEALRLLVGRGGNPDKADQFGNTALHLAAARGHQDCVSFLINFGVNLFALDIDQHSAKELASINNRDAILIYLDGETAKLEATDKKRAKAMREKAKKDSEKRARKYNKKQSKVEQEQDRMEGIPRPMPHRPSTVITALKQKWSGSQGNLAQSSATPTTFSTLVNGTVSGPRGGKSAVERRANAAKNAARNGTIAQSGEFTVRKTEDDGKRSVRSLSGVRRDSEVLYVGTFENTNNTRRGKLANVFDVPESENGESNGMTRSLSQPDFLALNSAENGPSEDVLLQEPASMFVKPGFGSVVFRRSLATLNGFGGGGEELSIGSAGSLAASDRPRAVKSWTPQDDDLSDSDSSEDNSRDALARFLTVYGLSEYIPKFEQEHIDLDALLLLTEDDLKTVLKLPLGPHRKLEQAISNRKAALQNPGPIVDSRL